MNKNAAKNASKRARRKVFAFARRRPHDDEEEEEEIEEEGNEFCVFTARVNL